MASEPARTRMSGAELRSTGGQGALADCTPPTPVTGGVRMRATMNRNHMAENLLELHRTPFVGSRIGVISLVAAAGLTPSACCQSDKQPPSPPATSESPASAPAT